MKYIIGQMKFHFQDLKKIQLEILQTLAKQLSNFFPDMVELHNYAPANSLQQKQYNWTTLNQKVLKKLGFIFSKNDVQAVINCTPLAIEKVLFVIKQMIEKRQQIQKKSKDIQEQKKNNHIKNQQELSYDLEQTSQVQNQEYNEIHTKMLQEKDITINELAQTIQILELKIQKLEQLVTLKDNKIHTLVNKLAQQGI